MKTISFSKLVHFFKKDGEVFAFDHGSSRSNPKIRRLQNCAQWQVPKHREFMKAAQIDLAQRGDGHWTFDRVTQRWRRHKIAPAFLIAFETLEQE